MTIDKGYRRIQDLVRALAEAERALEQGRLQINGLEQACDDARELYERLVVLRHKAREGERPQPPAAALALAAEPPPPPIVPPSSGPTIRLDTRAEIRQTSLIDAIEETEGSKKASRAGAKATAKSGKPAGAGAAPPPSIAEKLSHAPISDLGKAIALSQKFWFVAELFGGDRAAFEETVSAINNCPGSPEARKLMDARIAVLKKAPAPEALKSFNELIERRFR
ncbi:MAG: hypothetical protein IPG69_06155 [Flavobacteriales bacterium]|nr:hypothetical protein [Flavobacteriales bacterium]